MQKVEFLMLDGTLCKLTLRLYLDLSLGERKRYSNRQSTYCIVFGKHLVLV